MTKLNPGMKLAPLLWVLNRFLAKLEVVNFSTYLVIIRNFKWAGNVIFWAWHQNRSGILQVHTNYDYTEITNTIWPLFQNFTQSILEVRKALFRGKIEHLGTQFFRQITYHTLILCKWYSWSSFSQVDYLHRLRKASKARIYPDKYSASWRFLFEIFFAILELRGQFQRHEKLRETTLIAVLHHFCPRFWNWANFKYIFFQIREYSDCLT